MLLYVLTPEEADLINALNMERQDSLLIVCGYGDYVGVDPDAIQSEEFSDYLSLLSGFDESKIVDIPYTSEF